MKHLALDVMIHIGTVTIEHSIAMADKILCD